MTVYSLNQEVIVQTDKGEVRGTVRSAWSVDGLNYYGVLPEGERSLQKLQRNVEAERVTAA